MARRYFLFMYPYEADVRSLLSLAVFALNPNERWPAHVTVAGPFNNRPRVRAKFEGHVPAFCLGIGNFFNQGLNTVYLHIGVRNLDRVWRKPDFSGDPVPHLSLYNGQDRDFALQVYSEMNLLKPWFSFSATGLTLVTSISGQSVTALREQINVKLLDETSGLRIDEIREMGEQDRLAIAKRAVERCKELRGYKHPESGVIENPLSRLSGLRSGLRTLPR